MEMPISGEGRPNQTPVRDPSEWTYREVKEWALRNLFPKTFDVEVDGVKCGLTITTESVIFSPETGASRGCDMNQVRAVRIVDYDTAEILYSAGGKIESILAKSTEGWRPKVKSSDPRVDYYDAPIGRSYTFAQYISEVSDANVVDHYGVSYGRIAPSEFEERVRRAREATTKIDSEHKQYFDEIYFSHMSIIYEGIWGLAKVIVPISYEIMFDLVSYEARRKIVEAGCSTPEIEQSLQGSQKILLEYHFPI